MVDVVDVVAVVDMDMVMDAVLEVMLVVANSIVNLVLAAAVTLTKNSAYGWGDNAADEYAKSQGAGPNQQDNAVTDPTVPVESKTEPEVEEEPEPEVFTYEEAMEKKKSNFVKQEYDVRATANDEFKGKTVVKLSKKVEVKASNKSRKKKTGRGVAMSIDAFAGTSAPAPQRTYERRSGHGFGHGGHGHGRGRGGRGGHGHGGHGHGHGGRRNREFNANLADDSSFPGLGN